MSEWNAATPSANLGRVVGMMTVAICAPAGAGRCLKDKQIRRMEKVGNKRGNGLL